MPCRFRAVPVCRLVCVYVCAGAGGGCPSLHCICIDPLVQRCSPSSPSPSPSPFLPACLPAPPLHPYDSLVCATAATSHCVPLRAAAWDTPPHHPPVSLLLSPPFLSLSACACAGARASPSCISPPLETASPLSSSLLFFFALSDLYMRRFIAEVGQHAHRCCFALVLSERLGSFFASADRVGFRSFFLGRGLSSCCDGQPASLCCVSRSSTTCFFSPTFPIPFLRLRSAMPTLSAHPLPLFLASSHPIFS